MSEEAKVGISGWTEQGTNSGDKPANVLGIAEFARTIFHVGCCDGFVTSGRPASSRIRMKAGKL